MAIAGPDLTRTNRPIHGGPSEASSEIEASGSHVDQDGGQTVSDTTAANQLEELRTIFSGDVLTPSEEGYDEARLVHNGLVDRRPQLIAQCQNTADVADAIAYARQADLEVSVRGGGHNVAGLAVADGCLMVDLSQMKGVHVDAGARRVRAQGGVLWGEYNRATHAYGLATTGGFVSTTGVAGLTLGGGVGWLMPKYGMAMDNLVSAEIVTADGHILTVSEETDPDLFWAVRGAGANFGVVSSFEFDAHPLTSICGGLVAFDLSDAAQVFGTFRAEGEGSPDELMTMAVLAHAPDGSGAQVVGIAACHCGEPSRAQAELAPLRAAAPAFIDTIGPLTYPAMNTLFDAGYPQGARNYWRSAFFSELSDDAVAVMVDAFKQTPSAMSSIGVEHFHGQVTRLAPTDTAFPHRQPGYNLVLTAVWTDPADDEANIVWARRTFASLAPFMADAVYVNYLDADETSRARTAYGPNWERLVALKRRYDPDNVFHLNLNITP